MPNGDTGIDDDCHVFMSYRRSDDPNFTGRFHDKLIGVFGETNVFRDIDSLSAGTRFADVITESLDHVDAVVALIGPTWVGRLASPTDFVRMEISHALKAGKPVVPVLIEDTPMPETSALPEDLQSLLEINAVRVRRDPDFHRDAARVIAGIRENVHLARARQLEIQRQNEVAEAERARAAKLAEEEQERQSAEKRRIEAERQAAEDRAREAALRRRLEDELAKAEAEEAERRKTADALETERLERLAELARLEDEATRRQIAEERTRLAAIEDAKHRRDEELLAAQTRAQELRELLAQPGPLAPVASDIVREPLPPPVVIPESTAPPAAVPEVVADNQGPQTSPRPVQTGLSRLRWVTSNRAYVIGVACLLGATALGIDALFVVEYYGSGALTHGILPDLAAFVCTLGLLAPLLARTPRDAAALTTGVAVGYLGYQALGWFYWFWGVRGANPWQRYEVTVVIVALLLVAARRLFRSPDGRDARAPRVTTGARAVQVVLAVAINIATVIFLIRYPAYHRENHDVEDFVSTAALMPRVASLLLAPGLVLIVWATRRSRPASISLVALAAYGIVAAIVAAYDTDVSSSTIAHGEYVFAAIAAVAIAVWRGRTLVGRESEQSTGY